MEPGKIIIFLLFTTGTAITLISSLNTTTAITLITTTIGITTQTASVAIYRQQYYLKKNQ